MCFLEIKKIHLKKKTDKLRKTIVQLIIYLFQFQILINVMKEKNIYNGRYKKNMSKLFDESLFVQHKHTHSKKLKWKKEEKKLVIINNLF